MPDKPFSVPLSDHALVGMVAVLFVLMLLPFYPGWSVQESYLESSGDEPQMSFIHHQTFVDQTPLDVLIAGGSYAWNGLDPKVLEHAFSQRYRRPFRAINVALNEGKDQTYLFVKNLTMRRKVRMVIINDFFSPISTPHENAFRRWLLTEHWDLMGQLPIKSSLGFYTESILGAPRHLLSLLRPNRPAHLPERQKFFESNGFNPLRGNFRNLTQFTDFNPELLPIPAEELFYRDDFQEKYLFKNESPDETLLIIHRALARQLQDMGIELVYVHIPRYHLDYGGRRVEANFNPLRWIGPDGEYLAAPRSRLFAGLGDADLQRLYFNNHLNENGARAFTRQLIPALAQLLDRTEGVGNNM